MPALLLLPFGLELQRKAAKQTVNETTEDQRGAPRKNCGWARFQTIGIAIKSLRLTLTLRDVLLLAEVVGAVRLAALRATAPPAGGGTEYRTIIHLNGTPSELLRKRSVRRRPLLGGFLRALSRRLLLFLRLVLRAGIPVPLGAFLVLLQDLQNRGRGQLRHSALRIYVLLDCFVRETRRPPF